MQTKTIIAIISIARNEDCVFLSCAFCTSNIEIKSAKKFVVNAICNAASYRLHH